MVKNYFKTAWRTLWKNKVFSAINVLGLAIGISASLVIYLLVSYHLSFDKFERDRDRIYRVVSAFVFSGENYYNSGVTSPMGAAVKKEIPGLEAVVPFRTWNGSGKVSVPVANKTEPVVFKNQDNIVFADENYFNLIGYDWLAGSAKTSLLQPYQTVLTQSAASLYFPKLQAADIVGKHFYIDDTVAVTVTGVVKDITANTDFSFKVFVSKPTLETTSLQPQDYTQWGSTNGASQLYLKLAAGTSRAKIEKQIIALYNRNNKREPGDNSKTSYVLQPLQDIHFNSDYGTYAIAQASTSVLFGLLAVALFLLLLGCINFINLTTAQSAQRAKEIGIRKTMGSSRQQLIFQFLSEAFLLSFTATLLSVLLTPLILKAFSGFVPDAITFNILKQPGILLFLSCLILVVTLLSGLYPALILSSYKPVLVLKNQIGAGTAKTRNAWLRKTLTVSQFVIAQFFIMATLLVGKQISYSLNKNMGFKKEAIVYFRTNFFDTVQSHKLTLLNKLRSIPEISMVSLCNNPPSSNSTWSGTMKYKDGKKEIEADVQQKYGDTNYVKLYGIQVLAGRNLSSSDTVKELLINETYLHILGFQKPQDAIGKTVDWGNNKQLPVIGVVSDFNQRSLHEPVKPLIITSAARSEQLVSIRLQPQNASGTTWKTALKKTEKAFKEIYPDDDFDYSFFDEDIAKYYDQERHTSGLLNWATGLAVFISCLGLLGLVMYTTTQRTKEIGVRKVLGANVSQLVTLLSKDFIILVIIAFVIAAPLAWLGMNQWLQNFAYRTEISWWIFVAAGLLMIAVALVTLSFQTIRAAIANPVKSLRTE